MGCEVLGGGLGVGVGKGVVIGVGGVWWGRGL